MAREALFAGLVIDEDDHIVETALVGQEPCYVVDDAGFKRHIPSEQVDRMVLQFMTEMVEGNEEELGEQAAKMLGQEDIFSRAVLIQQFKNLEQQLDKVLEYGIPEDGRNFMGMAGFRVRINMHGDVLEIKQPGIASDE